jgi:hypothetical protein
VPASEEPRFEACYEALEYAFCVRTDLPRLGPAADLLLRPFRSSTDGRGPAYSLVQLRHSQRYGLRLGRGRLVQLWTTGALLGQLMFDINREAIQRTRRWVLVHAGAVAWKGRGILLPATSESGKTTLVAGLIRAGFDYLTDEAAAIDPETEWLHPYPKPLTLKNPSIDLLSGLRERLLPEFASPHYFEYHVPAHTLRPRSVGRACKVRFVVFPQYRADAQTLLSQVSKGEALFTLSQNSFNLERFGPQGMKVLADLVRDAQCYRLSMHDLESSVRVLQDLVREC